MKIVISTHIKYGKPLTLLLQQLSKSVVHPKDIIIVVAGANADSAPYLQNMKCYNSDMPDMDCIIIESKLNNFEYTSYNSLNKYRKCSFILSNTYLVIHDTCTLNYDFDKKYSVFSKINFGTHHAWLYTVTHQMFCNIALVNNQLIENVADNFNCELTKPKAVRLESGSLEVEMNGRKVLPLNHFGKKIEAGKKVYLNPEDIYSTGHPRLPARYDIFGITKWIFHCNEGDFTGDVKKILNWRNA